MNKIAENLKMNNLTRLFLVLVSFGLLLSCDNEDDMRDDQMATVVVRMTDAPGDFEEVNIEVLDVMIKSDVNDNDEGWQSIGDVETGIYNLLDLTGGVTALLAEAQLAPGYLGQIRLILGNDNTVVIDGESQALSTPSAQQSGLKLKVDQAIEAGELYEFLLDFDVDQSIVTAGNSGGFILKPVIRLSTVEGSAKIVGEVHPSAIQGLGIQSVVRATNANNTIAAYTDVNGGFVLNGVPAGVYQVTITPAEASGLNVKTLNNIEVTSGATLDLETIFLD